MSNHGNHGTMSNHGKCCILCNKQIVTRDIKQGGIISLHKDATHLCHNVCFRHFINDPAMLSIYGMSCPICSKKMDVHEYVNVAATN